MAEYTAIFNKPYADGYEDLPSQNTPITAQTLNDKDAVIEHIEDYLSTNDIPTYDEKTSTSGEFKTLSGGIMGSCVINLSLVQSGSGTPSPQNVRPITGHSSVEVDVTDADSNTTQYTVALGQTVYGGTLDAVSGELTITHGYKDMGSLSWTAPSATYQYFQATVSDMVATYTTITSNGHFMCSNYGYAQITGNNTNEGMCLSGNYLRVRDNDYATAAAFTTAMSGVQFVYELATPITIQLTPQQIETLIGQNNVTVPLDGQSLDSLTYREVLAWDDVQTAIDSATATKADISVIGTDESGRTTASRSYAQGEHFYKDGKFGTTKTGVAQGATWTLDTNYVEGDVATEITNKIVTDDFTISVGNVASGTTGAEITQSVAKTGYEAVGVVIREGSGSWWTVCDYLLLIKNNVLSVFANNFSPNNASSVSIKVRVTYAKI